MSRGRQSGITAIGFLILASLCGIVGLGALKVGPMYMQNMRLGTILGDLQQSLASVGIDDPSQIRAELNRRFAVEGLRIPRENVTITQTRAGYRVQIENESRARFLGDVYFLVTFNDEIELTR